MKNTKQRNVIYNTVLSSQDHPSANDILIRAKEKLNSINIATVYRNLNYLTIQGLIKKVELSTGDRFDHTLSEHGHFHCTMCDKVSDFDDHDLIEALIAQNHNCKILDTNIMISGICENCLKEGEKL